MDQISTIKLGCGMPLVVEKIPGVRSVGLTWLLPAGSARDPGDKVGYSALAAEMLVRGSESLDSRQQADAFDRLGVSRGTGVETFTMSISATLLGSRVADALPLIVDMVRRPRMDEAGFEPSKELCLAAIESLKDDPQERVMHTLRRLHAPEPINRSSLGTEEGILEVTHGDMRRLWIERALPVGSVLALAGDVDAAKVADQLNVLLAGWSGSAGEVTWGKPTTRGYHHEKDETNQVHIALAYDAPPETDEACWLERVATAVLSGGMSGRLFTEVREKRSLCYSVYASYGADAKFGRTVAYSGTTPERAQETLNVLLGELRRVRSSAGAITREEFTRAIVGLKSKLVMSGESTGARAAALARDWMKLGRPRSLAELAAKYDGVTLEKVNEHLGRTRELGEITVTTIGPEELVVREV